MISTPKVSLLASCAAVLALSGCIDPVNYETEPVEVKTPKGVVVCQLYTRERVLWDEAISVPAGMSIEEGDAICLIEGKRQKRG